jgi:pyridoxal 5'-phosphate synthase pdxT subunit
MTFAKPVIGVLALQGAVQPHKAHIEAAGGEFRAVKTAEQFDEVNAFILPGGESTTMLKLIDAFDLWDSLEKNFKSKPVWGICAGSILLAKKVTDPEQKSFGTLPITVQRNAYGRQLESHHAEINGYPVSLIRAPIITNAGRAEVLAEHEGKPVWVRSGKNMATTFHPELTLQYPSPMHEMFVKLAK